MSTQFEDEADSILKNAPEPDADAATIREHDDGGAAPPRRRGRPPGSGAGKKPKTNVVKFTPLKPDEYIDSAKAVNTVIFSTACIFVGTGDAWPQKEKEDIMDKALARYMSLKNYAPPPEMALIAAYAGYVHEIAQKETVKTGFLKRFGGIGLKFGFVRNFVEKIKNKLGKEKNK
jgi:hypothetical protein